MSLSIRGWLRLCLVFCMHSLSAQHPKVDSLKTLIERTVEPVKTVNLYSDIAVEFYDNQIYHDSAYYYTERAYNMAKKHGLKNQEARALFNFGMIHSALGDYDKAIENYEKARFVFKELNTKSSLSVVNSSIAALNFEKKDYKSAIFYFEKAIAISTELKDSIGMAIDYTNLGETEYKMGDYRASKEHIEKALNLFDILGLEVAGTHIYYGNTLLVLGETDKAFLQGSQGYRLAHKDQDLRKITEASDLMHRLSLVKKDYQMAMSYLQEHVTYKDSVNAAKELNNIEKLKLNFDLSRKEKELAYISQRSKYLNIIYILGGLGVLLLLILISRQRKVTRMTRDIHDIQRRLVAGELEERELRKNRNTRATSNFKLTKSQDSIINQ